MPANNFWSKSTPLIGEGFNQPENARGDHAINVELEFTDRKVFKEALTAAWINSANKRTPLSKKSKRKK